MYIKVMVLAGMRKESIEKNKENSYTISVKEKAVRNMANDRVISILGEIYKTSPKNVRIINGHHSPSKLVVIRE